MKRLLQPSLSRDVVPNLTGQALPMLVALVTAPSTMAQLGAERFGLLALAMTVLASSTIWISLWSGP